MSIINCFPSSNFNIISRTNYDYPLIIGKKVPFIFENTFNSTDNYITSQVYLPVDSSNNFYFTDAVYKVDGIDYYVLCFTPLIDGVISPYSFNIYQGQEYAIILKKQNLNNTYTVYLCTAENIGVSSNYIGGNNNADPNSANIYAIFTITASL